MEGKACFYPYESTGYFNKIATDYVSGAETLRPFYEHRPDAEGIKAAIRARENFSTPRSLLVQVLKDQYSKAALDGHPKVQAAIESLGDEHVFTVCTAHQPNIFTGYLYFVYKILHAVRLAESLNASHAPHRFVPVYYMGSEDADLEELGKVFLNGEKLEWDTQQTGAVGRMNTRGLDKLIGRISSELDVLPYGSELSHLLREAYSSNHDIQTATFFLLHRLFADYGLVVLIADDPRLKALVRPVFEDDLFRQQPSQLVEATTARLAENYKVQASPRAINLFYLEGDLRNRIEKDDTGFHVVDTDLHFTEEEMRHMLTQHPERFSPNVILRGLYQESILPNIAFIGGGGELAYWLELKDLFHHYRVPYPVQVLRNSFLLVDDRSVSVAAKLGFEEAALFLPEQELLNQLVKRDSAAQVHLTNEIRDAAAFYQHLQQLSGQIDQSLEAHVDALQQKMLKQLRELEKKMLRAEKRKFSDQSRQIAHLKAALFPRNNLQERVENFMPYYARYGKDFLQWIYEASPALQQEFIVYNLPVTVQVSN